MQPTITLPNGTVKTVKNLGWLLRHKNEVAIVTAYRSGLIVARTYNGITYRCTFADLSIRESWLAKRFPQTVYTLEHSEVTLPDPCFTFDDIDYWYQFDTEHTSEQFWQNKSDWITYPAIFAPGEPRGLTLYDAQHLTAGSTLYHTTKRNANGTAMRAKVTSVKTWKRSPQRVEVHLKHGMYDFAVFDETDIHLMTRTEPEPIKVSRKK